MPSLPSRIARHGPLTNALVDKPPLLVAAHGHSLRAVRDADNVDRVVTHGVDHDPGQGRKAQLVPGHANASATRVVLGQLLRQTAPESVVGQRLAGLGFCQADLDLADEPIVVVQRTFKRLVRQRFDRDARRLAAAASLPSSACDRCKTMASV